MLSHLKKKEAFIFVKLISIELVTEVIQILSSPLLVVRSSVKTLNLEADISPPASWQISIYVFALQLSPSCAAPGRTSQSSR